MSRVGTRSKLKPLGIVLALLAAPLAAQSTGIRVTAAPVSKLAGDDATTSNGCSSPLKGDVCMTFAFSGGSFGPGSTAPEVTITEALIAEQTGFAGCVIRDLNPAVNIFHPASGQLSVTLERSAEEVPLWAPIGGCGSALNTRFDDQAPGTPAGCPLQPIMRPAQPLEPFTGSKVEGNWRLRIDNPTHTQGSLQSWGFAADLDCASSPAAPPPSECVPSPTTLCLGGNRFEVTTSWRTNDNRSGQGFGVRLTEGTGYFWFFDPDNVELMVKVLDACADPFHRFWVFTSGATNVEVTLLVTDTLTHETKLYINPLNRLYQTIADTDAFACP